jgi:class 3 adenylate cyclase
VGKRNNEPTVVSTADPIPEDPYQDTITMDDQESSIYRIRFENLFRVAKKITSSLNIGDILEMIRDEIKTSLPHAQEACMILVDPGAPEYTRPLHCAVKRDQVNCHQCKRGKEIVAQALEHPSVFHCRHSSDPIPDVGDESPSGRVCEIALSLYDGKEPLAILNVVAKSGEALDESEIVLLQDLVDLATNTLINAKNHSRTLREKLTLERILGHIRPFVPETVRRIVEKNPDAPSFQRAEVDVSILFLDMADYTRISEFLTQDKVNFIIEKYFSNFLDIIYAHDGDVNETAGDGLMAIFQGSPEENAFNAARAALELRNRTLEINRELEGLFYPVMVNMGINSGPASVGMHRFEGSIGTRTTFTASGPVTNLASRIASAAKEGDILVGPETAVRIRNKMTLFGRGRMSFKNVTGLVHIFGLIPPQ